jgi:hypothetical protein
MIMILAVVIALVAWALHLMQLAIDRKEFSLMLAGFLVASAATGLIAVYFLMLTSLDYWTQIDHRSLQVLSDADTAAWVMTVE